MSNSSSAFWIAFLEEKKRPFLQQGCKVIYDIGNEDAFRTAFEKLARQHKVKYPARLLVRLGPSFENIILFAEAVAKPVANLPSDALTALVWGVAFATIMQGSRCKTKIDNLVKLAHEVNRAAPLFEPDNCLHPEDLKVQGALQDFLTTYVDSYIFLLSAFGQDSPPHAKDQISEAAVQKHVKEATKKYEDLKVEYGKLVSLAAQNKERERRKAKELANGFSHLPEVPQKGKTPAYQIPMQLEFQRKLGRGTFSQVDEVLETSTGQLYACKRIRLDEGSSMGFSDLENTAKAEVAVMQKLHHHHIASVLFSIQETHCYNIFMLPVADCDLRQYLENCDGNGFPTALVNPIFQWFGCLLDALNHAHKLQIKHRDIKPANILIKNEKPYLADFGLARDFSDQDSSISQSIFVEGTPVYFAPENQPRGNHGRPADIFALGCVFSEMLTVGNHMSLAEYRDWRRVPEGVYGSFAFRENLPKVREWLRRMDKGQPNELLSYQILGMIHKDPDQRPTAQEGVNILYRQRALFCIE